MQSKVSNPFHRYMYKQVTAVIFETNEWKTVFRSRLTMILMIIYLIRLLAKLIFGRNAKQSEPKVIEIFILEYLNQSYFNNDPLFMLVTCLIILLGIMIRWFHKFDQTYENKHAWFSLFDIIELSVQPQERLPEEQTSFIIRYFDNVPIDMQLKLSIIQKRLDKIIFSAHFTASKLTD